MTGRHKPLSPQSKSQPLRATQWGWHQDGLEGAGEALADRRQVNKWYFVCNVILKGRHLSVLVFSLQEALKLALESLNKSVRPRLPSAPQTSAAMEDHYNSASRVYAKLDSARAFSASATKSPQQRLTSQSAGKSSHDDTRTVLTNRAHRAHTCLDIDVKETYQQVFTRPLASSARGSRALQLDLLRYGSRRYRSRWKCVTAAALLQLATAS